MIGSNRAVSHPVCFARVCPSVISNARDKRLAKVGLFLKQKLESCKVFYNFIRATFLALRVASSTNVLYAGCSRNSKTLSY